MKKSLYALIIIVFSTFGLRAFAALIEVNQVSKITIDSEDGTGPGGNGSVKNGVVRTQ